jgi:hypothetical protein
MELFEVAGIVVAFIAFAIIDTWYYRVYRERKAADRGYNAGRVEGVVASSAEWLKGLSREDLLATQARLKAELHRRRTIRGRARRVKAWCRREWQLWTARSYHYPSRGR